MSSIDYDGIIKDLGISALEEADSEELTQSLDSLSSPSLEISALDAGSSPSALAMGDNDVKNIFYVNFNPEKDKLSPSARKQLVACQTNVDLTTNFLSLKSGIQTQAKIDAGQLPSDMTTTSQMKRASYRAKVTDFLIRKSSWMGSFAAQGVSRQFNCEKSEFHAQLLTNVLKGLGIPGSVFGKIESLLNEISNSVTTSSHSSTSKMFWILVTIYTWEPVMQQMRPTVRTIYFEVSNGMSDYTSNKSRRTRVSFNLGYVQGDCVFNNNVFEGGAKQSIQSLLNQSGTNIVNDPINVDV